MLAVTKRLGINFRPRPVDFDYSLIKDNSDKSIGGEINKDEPQRTLCQEHRDEQCGIRKEVTYNIEINCMPPEVFFSCEVRAVEVGTR